MKKVVIAVAVVAAVAIVGIVMWLVIAQPPATNTSTTQGTTTSSDPESESATSSEEVPLGEVIVVIKNTSFSPATLTVKKGTTIKWTNEDTVRHNIVADEANNAAGLPTENELFGKGGSYSFTFNELGTFNYHCTPHPFMKGTIEVVE